MTDSSNNLPRLRVLDPQLTSQNGRQLILMRDPLQIGDKMVAIPYELAPLLVLCDGTRTIGELVSALAVRFGLSVSPQIIERFLTICDEAMLLDNDHFAAARATVLAGYRTAPYRAPALAGLSYPADAGELAQLFEQYRQRGVSAQANGRNGTGGEMAGIISPHIDYQRGGPVYAAVWGAAESIVRSAEIAVVFGTDHYGAVGALTLTHQSYATPFGVLPTPSDIVETLARAIGPERAFADELHHRSEHSVELALNWLHFLRRDLPPIPVVPILCGSFHHFVSGQGRPDRDPAISSLVHTLSEQLAGHRAVIVAGADLSHVGPAFGGPRQDSNECGHVQAADQEIIEHMCQGDAGGFFESVRMVGDRYNVCGLSPIYLALRQLAAGRSNADSISGRQVAYDTCPADDNETSFVSICGVILE